MRIALVFGGAAALVAAYLFVFLTTIAVVFLLSAYMWVSYWLAFLSFIPGVPGNPSPAPPGGPAPILCTSGSSPTITTVSIRNLCFGPSSPAQIKQSISTLNSRSPLVGKANFIVEQANLNAIDPLLIFQWQHESGMATSPHNGGGANNGGNIIWDAAKNYPTWNCSPAPVQDNGFQFARCETLEDGIGLFFNYVGRSSLYAPDKAPHLRAYAEIYNPCFPGNTPCGASYAENILETIKKYARQSVAPPQSCPPALPYVRSESPLAMAIRPEAMPLLSALLNGRGFQITQGFGYVPVGSDFARYEPPYAGYPHFHQGLDLGLPIGIPLYVPYDGTITNAGYDPGQGLTATLQLPNGVRITVMHLSQLPQMGRVSKGDFFGRSGNTGGTTGPHLHVQAFKDGNPIPPEHWACKITS